MSTLVDFEALTLAGRAVFNVSGMWCASCAMALERAISRVPGVESTTVNFTSQSALIIWDVESIDFKTLLERVERLGYGIHLMAEEDNNEAALKKQYKRLVMQLTLALFFGMWSMMGSWILYLSINPPSVEYKIALATFFLSFPVIFYSGLDFYKAAFKTLRVGVAGMDALISMGVWGSFLISLWHLLMGDTKMYVDAATMLITFLLIGRVIEIRAKQESSQAVNALKQLTPEIVTIIENNDEKTVPIEILKNQTMVLVRAGERIAVDGIIVEGESDINSSLLTGESYPVAVKKGEEIFAGAINLTSPLYVKSTQPYGKRRIDELGLRMLELFGGRSTLAKTAETFIRILFPLALTASFLSFFYYQFYLLLPLDKSLLGALSILVAACPCAVGMALPLAYVLGSHKAALAKILWRDAASVENLAQAKVLAFDKTGTLTYGELVVENVVARKEEELFLLLWHAKKAEAGSAHPIAEAIRAMRVQDFLTTQQYLQWQEKEQKELSINENYQEKPRINHFSQGVEMVIGESTILVGAYPWLINRGVKNLPELKPHHVYMAKNNEWYGTLQLQDHLRPNLTETLTTLKQKFKVKLWLITGDTRQATENLLSALTVKFAKIKTESSPEEKAEYLLEAKEHPIAFIGDGANDALVLASSDCGIAIPGASSVAVSAAGMVITQGGIEKVVEALSLSRKFYRIVKQNLFFSTIYNAAVIGLFFVTGVTPFAAAIAMLLSSLSVLLNTLRLMRP